MFESRVKRGSQYARVKIRVAHCPGCVCETQVEMRHKHQVDLAKRRRRCSADPCRGAVAPAVDAAAVGRHNPAGGCLAGPSVKGAVDSGIGRNRFLNVTYCCGPTLGGSEVCDEQLSNCGFAHLLAMGWNGVGWS